MAQSDPNILGVKRTFLSNLLIYTSWTERVFLSNAERRDRTPSQVSDRHRRIRTFDVVPATGDVLRTQSDLRPGKHLVLVSLNDVT